MSPSAATLDALPAELLSRIGTFCDPTSILALSRVSHLLRQTCYDILVLKEVFQSQVAQLETAVIFATGGTQPQTPFDNYKVLTDNLDQNKQLWARYSLAIRHFLELEKLTKDDIFYMDFDDQLQPFLKKTLLYLPQVLAYGFAGCLFSQFMDRYASAAEHVATEKHFGSADFNSRFAFCFTIESLRISQQIRRVYASQFQRGIEAYFGRCQIHLFADDFEVTWHDQCQSQFKTALFARFLARRPGYVTPMVEKIAFLSDRSACLLPRPFISGLPEPDSWEKWLQYHMYEITGPAALEGSKWQGYYSEDLKLYRFGSMMHIAGFRIRDRSDDSCVVESNGWDGVGVFTLLGTLARTTGQVFMSKQYVGRHAWSWTGTMTPFGIIGCWHSGRPSDRARGLFWIWRAEWSPIEHHPVP